MAVRPVLTIGNPLLRQVARDLDPAELRSAEFRRVVDDMIDTMHHEQGVGIAAPQIGESLQAAVIEITVDSTRYPDMQPFGLRVFINPRVTVLDPEVDLEEVDDRQIWRRLAVGHRAALDDEPAMGPMGVGNLPDQA